MLLVFDLDDTLYDKHTQLGDDPTAEDIGRITPYEGVIDFLSSCPDPCVLVTHESIDGLQEKKLDVLGIRDYFKQIVICQSGPDKYLALSRFIEQYPGEKIIVIGDRIDKEIYYANKLGLVSVRLARGKYAHLVAEDAQQEADHTVESFLAFVELVKTL